MSSHVCLNTTAVSLTYAVIYNPIEQQARLASYTASEWTYHVNKIVCGKKTFAPSEASVFVSVVTVCDRKGTMSRKNKNFDFDRA